VAAKSIAAIPAGSIPFIGVAVLIADTGYELYAACETVRDLDQLYSDLGMADEVQEDAMHSVCDPELPAAGEVWGGVNMPLQLKRETKRNLNTSSKAWVVNLHLKVTHYLHYIMNRYSTSPRSILSY
jgi:hypothetical protein